jgi:hypothetical protein
MNAEHAETPLCPRYYTGRLPQEKITGDMRGSFSQGSILEA